MIHLLMVLKHQSYIKHFIQNDVIHSILQISLGGIQRKRLRTTEN